MNTPILYVNGRKTNVLNANTVKEGDVVEYFTDSSIYRFVEWRINDLRTFDSLRDLKRYYRIIVFLYLLLRLTTMTILISISFVKILMVLILLLLVSIIIVTKQTLFVI